jgi:RNA polymerase sigma-70 factor (ECF subfamily)
VKEKLAPLLKAASKGDKGAFEELAREIGKRILTIAQRVLNDRFYAEDVLNTVLYKTWQNLDKIVKLDNFLGYINTIAYNTAISIGRKRREVPLYDNVPSPFKDYEERIDAEVALSALSEEERLIVMYHTHAGYSFREIGELLNLTKKAVYLRYQKAVAELKRRLV